MGSNVWNNAVFLLQVLFIISVFVIVFTVMNQMNTRTQAAIAQTGVDITTTEWTQKYTEWKQFFLVNFQFLLYLFVLLAAYTSFVNSNDIKTYAMSALAGTIVTIVCIQVGTLFWNSFVTSSYLDFSDFSAGDLWFVSNFQTILVINLLASVASFIFVAKPRQQEMGF